MTFLPALARWFRRNKGWLALTAVLVGVIVVDEMREAERKVDLEARLAGMVFSRADVKDVRMPIDDSVMHGPKSFYFKASESNIARLLRWLDARPQQAIPDWLVGRVDLARSKVDRPFDWKTPKIYANLHCPDKADETKFDLVLVDGPRVVYMTTGYGATGRAGSCTAAAEVVRTPRAP